MNTQTTSVHGHDVLNLIAAANPALTRQSFDAEAIRRWGPDARFHTCSMSGLTLAQLVTFLISHGKIVERNGQLATDESKICQH